jgi:hypothetical protein
MASNELEYCMMRAREESRRALRSNRPEAAAVHQRLSIKYSARAFLLRTQEDDFNEKSPIAISA